MKLMKYYISFLMFVVLIGCTRIPTKVPELIEVSSNKVLEQNTLIISEWESSIAANNSAQKLLDLIYKNKDKIEAVLQDEESKNDFENFIKAYPVVKKQLSESVQQDENTQVLKNNVQNIIEAIKTANSYIAESVDENARINALIESIKSITNKENKNE